MASQRKPNPSDFDNIPTLILALEVSVREDMGPPGFDGSVSIGVTDAGKTTWWNASFMKQARITSIDHAPCASARATMRMGSREAKSVVSQGQLQLGPTDFETSGDPHVMSQFIARYTSNRSALDLRMNGVR